ncbi:MAG: hypothetical protein U1E78_10615 [Gammaproteobacteria bacterium]
MPGTIKQPLHVKLEEKPEYLKMDPAQFAVLPLAQQKEHLKAYQRWSKEKEAREHAEKDELEKKLRERLETTWRNASVPGKRLLAQGDSAADHIKSVLNYQLESIAIAAVINTLVYSMRIALGVQHTIDVAEYHTFSTKYVPYDPMLHKDFIELNPRDIKAGKVQLIGGESREGRYVPVNFDSKYHILFPAGPDGKPNPGWDSRGVPLNAYPHSTDDALIALNRYQPIGKPHIIEEKHQYFMAYDPNLHRNYTELNSDHLHASGARLVTRQANGDFQASVAFVNDNTPRRLVPLNFDPRYHKLFEGGVVGNRVVNDLTEPQETLDLIRMHGYVPKPTIWDSANKDIQTLMSMINKVSEKERANMSLGLGDDQAGGRKNGMGGYTLQQRPTPRSAGH